MHESEKWKWSPTLSDPMGCKWIQFINWILPQLYEIFTNEEITVNNGTMPFLEVRCLHVVELWPGEGNGTPLQYSWLENPMDGGASWASVHGVAKSQTQLSDFTFTFHFHALEKEMATHSSVLAWRIPGTGEPGGLLSMGSHRVGHDWSDLAAAIPFVNNTRCYIIIIQPWTHSQISILY